MQCIFKNPTTGKFEVGHIYKKKYTSKGKLLDVISEVGNVYTHLPIDPADKSVPGYVDTELSKTLMDYISTNLNLNNQANYKNKNFSPAIKKITV
jgi:hypothetical protein